MAEGTIADGHNLDGLNADGPGAYLARKGAGEATGPSGPCEGAGYDLAGSGLVGLLLGDQATDPLGQQGAVEGLLEGVVEPQAVGLVAGLVARQGDEDRGDVILALAEVLGDLTGLDAAD